MMAVWMGELVFWSGLVLINNLIFLPNYFLHRKEAFPLPFVSDLTKYKQIGLTGSLNMDPFRFSVELTVLLMVGRFLHAGIWYWSVVSALFLLAFIFHLYEYSFRKIYQYQPNLHNDGVLMKNAVSIVWHESPIKFILWVFGLVAVAVGMFLGARQFGLFSATIDSSLAFFTLSGAFIIWVLHSIRKNGVIRLYPQNMALRAHFSWVEIAANIRRARRSYRRSKLKIGKRFKSSRDVPKFALTTTPNIHFLFVESYGTTFYKHENLAAQSMAKWEEVQGKLEANGFGVFSHLSNSTTMSGQSWLTYASFFQGFRIDDNSDYENYLKDSDFNVSDNLIRVLKKQGYTHYHLNPIRPIKGIEVPFNELDRFFSIDKWILDADLEYKGRRYGFGECAPDQFAMNHAMEQIEADQPDPYILFYLTKNSHTPFIHPQLVGDWKSLNNEAQEGDHLHRGFLKEPKLEDYASAINYQLDNLADFINRHGKDNDIFWVMGDHQPPLLSDPDKHGVSTPVHIISKDQSFLESFRAYGFNTNLDLSIDPLKHEGLYSIFLRSLIQTYGQTDELIPYQPDGLQL